MDAENTDRLRSNIGDAISGMKRKGTTGASVDCLKANVSTKGLSCSPAVFHNEFEEHAREVAKTMRFNLYRKI